MSAAGPLKPKPHEITQLLSNVQQKQPGAEEQLLGMVYNELRHIAAAYMRRERPGHTLQPTALVHEAYLQLVDQTRVNWQSRAHFFGVASRLMRRILVDHARSHLAEKRGGSAQKLSLDEAIGVSRKREVALDALDDALNTLSEIDPRQSRIVELRFFGGLTVEETAEVLDTSTATIEREWRMAKAWLHGQLQA
jgi:RNA polymerase sigma factor (TIGR02999 family)